MSHDRIPVKEKEDSWQASRESSQSGLESIPMDVSQAFFLLGSLAIGGCSQMGKERPLPWDTREGELTVSLEFCPA